jgi:MOSC domain-containing protein YiiM
MAGRVESLWTAEYDSAPMERHESVEVVHGGVAGDRYCTGRGYYSPFDVCEVTLVEAEALDEVRSEFGIDLTDGRHRRNVVTRGVTVHDLLGSQFRVGDALLEGTRPRPPCAHVEKVAGEDGVMESLAGTRGGICASVVEPGPLAVGDEIRVETADPRSVGRAIVDRLRGREDD